MYALKIYRRAVCPDNDEWCKVWRVIDLPVQNWHEELALSEHSKISKMCIVMGCFWPRYVKEAHSKYFSWRWSVMQYLKKNWLVIWKRTWGIWKIFVRNFRLKMSKLGLWWDPFVQSRKLMNWKITEKLRVITSFILKLRTSSNEQ